MRDKQVDFLRGIAIICVVMGHINPVAQVNNFIYSFHMALFMFLAGITFYYSFSAKYVKVHEDKDFLSFPFQYVKKRFLQLIVPFMVWCVLLQLYFNGMGNVVNAIGNNFNRLWFFPTLYGVLLVAIIIEMTSLSAIAKWFGNHMAAEFLMYVMATAVAFSIFECTGIKLFRQMAVYIIPFSLGVFAKKYGYAIKIICDKRCSIICMILYLALLPMYDMSDKSLLTLGVRFVAGILFIQFIYNFTIGLNVNIYLEKQLCFLGKGSMAIYIIQEFFRPFFPILLNNVTLAIICHLIMSIIICYVAIMFFKILGLCNITSKIMTGRF